jgi:hypothetical protein
VGAGLPPFKFNHLRALMNDDFPTLGIPTTISLILFFYYKTKNVITNDHRTDCFLFCSGHLEYLIKYLFIISSIDAKLFYANSFNAGMMLPFRISPHYWDAFFIFYEFLLGTVFNNYFHYHHNYTNTFIQLESDKSILFSTSIRLCLPNVNFLFLPVIGTCN